MLLRYVVTVAVCFRAYLPVLVKYHELWHKRLVFCYGVLCYLLSLYAINYVHVAVLWRGK